MILELEIVKIVSEKFEVPLHELTSKKERGARQPTKLVEAKQVCAYLLWRHTRLTGDQVAGTLGYETHNNVIAARKRVKQIAEGNKHFADTLQSFEYKILRD